MPDLTKLPPSPPQAPVNADDNLTLEQRRLITVLERAIALARRDEDFVEEFTNQLEDVLNDLQSEDYFGKRGQRDPRGDQRESDWSMECVQGVDNPDQEPEDEDDDDEEDDSLLDKALGAVVSVGLTIVGLGTGL